MRISDWSSDVCSSDLLREDDRQIDYSIGIDNAVHSHRPIINESADGCGEFAKGRNDGGDVEAVQQAAGPGKSQGTAGSRIRHPFRSEEHTSELQSLMRISYAVFCLKKKKKNDQNYKFNKQAT